MRSDLKWNSHVKYICKKSNTGLWMIRRLKKLGASSTLLLDVYNKHVRSLLEYAVPAWGPNITKSNANDLERVQKCALSVIYGQGSYSLKLKSHDVQSLEERRVKLYTKFAKKSAKHEVFTKWFAPKSDAFLTRSKQAFKEVPARHQFFKNSPIPTMTHLLNAN